MLPPDRTRENKRAPSPRAPLALSPSRFGGAPLLASAQSGLPPERSRPRAPAVGGPLPPASLKRPCLDIHAHTAPPPTSFANANVRPQLPTTPLGWSPKDALQSPPATPATSSPPLVAPAPRQAPVAQQPSQPIKQGPEGGLDVRVGPNGLGQTAASHAPPRSGPPEQAVVQESVVLGAKAYSYSASAHIQPVGAQFAHGSSERGGPTGGSTFAGPGRLSKVGDSALTSIREDGFLGAAAAAQALGTTRRSPTVPLSPPAARAGSLAGFTSAGSHKHTPPPPYPAAHDNQGQSNRWHVPPFSNSGQLPAASHSTAQLTATAPHPSASTVLQPRPAGTSASNPLRASNPPRASPPCASYPSYPPPAALPASFATPSRSSVSTASYPWSAPAVSGAATVTSAPSPAAAPGASSSRTPQPPLPSSSTAPRPSSSSSATSSPTDFRPLGQNASSRARPASQTATASRATTAQTHASASTPGSAAVGSSSGASGGTLHLPPPPRQLQQQGGLVAAGAGGGDEPYAHIIFRQSSTDILFYPSKEVADLCGEEAAVQVAKSRILSSLQHYEEDGERAARAAWGAPLGARYATHIAFGCAKDPPSQWSVSGVPIPVENTGRSFLRALPSARRIVVIGVDGLCNDPAALYDEVATQLEPDVSILFTSEQTQGRAFDMTAEELCIGLEARLGIEGDEGDVVTPTFEAFYSLLSHGYERRTKYAEAAKDHRGEHKRASRRKRRNFKRPDDAPRKKLKDDWAVHEQPSSWQFYWRCGRNGCPYVAIVGQVERHREANTAGYIYCLGKCSRGCIFTQATVEERRQHMSDQHPELHLCSLLTCASAFASSNGRRAHEKRHADGSIWPYGLPAASLWVTLERANGRPVLKENKHDATGRPNPFYN